MNLIPPSLSRLFRPPAWRRVDAYELPEVDGPTSGTIHEFLVAAGGMALLLSRASPEDIRKHLPATNELYHLLRHQLMRHGRTTASAELLNDAMHEVSQVADPRTRVALRNCLQARADYEARRRRRETSPAPLTEAGFASQISAPGAIAGTAAADKPGAEPAKA